MLNCGLNQLLAVYHVKRDFSANNHVKVLHSPPLTKSRKQTNRTPNCSGLPQHVLPQASWEQTKLWSMDCSVENLQFRSSLYSPSKDGCSVESSIFHFSISSLPLKHKNILFLSIQIRNLPEHLQI